MSARGDAGGDGMLALLVDQGLISLVRAGADFTISSVRGRGAGDIAPGSKLCEAVPALFGLEAALEDLHRQPGQRYAITNVSLIDDAGASERQDFVVVADPATSGYVLSITPSFANDDLTVELEQNLRIRLQLETRVAAQARAIDATNEALRRTNADLVNFTRMISHDLKAPMRAIRYSAEDISEALADTDDEVQLVALDELRLQSVRLSQMVTDLLSYSRLGDKDLAVSAVDTDALVHEVVRSLPRPDGFVVDVIGEWPVIETTGVLLDVVLRNLIDNAIKHHDREDGRVTIEATTGATTLDIVIWDDGPGIPERYREAVLRPFRKVKKDQYEASGLGLTMVDKVISDVGGRLELGARPGGGRGARIAVAWPLTIAAT